MPDELGDWACCLWLDGAAGSVRAALSAVRSSVPYEIDSKELSQLVKVISLDAKRASRASERRQPLPLDLVREFVCTCPPDRSVWEWRWDAALLTLAVRLMMRPNEAEGLQLADVRFGRDGWLYVRPPFTKNDPGNSRTDGWEKPVETGLTVDCMRAWLSLRGSQPGPLWGSVGR